MSVQLAWTLDSGPHSPSSPTPVDLFRGHPWPWVSGRENCPLNVFLCKCAFKIPPFLLFTLQFNCCHMEGKEREA